MQFIMLVSKFCMHAGMETHKYVLRQQSRHRFLTGGITKSHLLLTNHHRSFLKGRSSPGLARKEGRPDLCKSLNMGLMHSH